MLKAELHGKLAEDARDAEYREDVLTSNVLGTFSYLPPALLLLPFLRNSVAFHSQIRLVAEDVTDAQIFFWPKIGTRQADALVCLSRPHDVDIVVVECKYWSDKSQLPVGDDEDPEELGEGGATGDQLADYLTGATRGEIRHAEYIRPEEVGRVALVYVTKDASMPRQALRESADCLSNAGGRVNDCALYWLPWSAAWSAVSEALANEGDEFRKRILTDLKKLMERKRLRPFLGFSRLAGAVPHVFGNGSWRRRWGLEPIAPLAPSWYRKQKLWKRVQHPARIPSHGSWRRRWCLVGPAQRCDFGESIFYRREAPTRTSG